jgi:hypothetical protein
MRILWSHKEEKYGLPDYIPDNLLNEQMADINHGQTLKRLNERNGMAVHEIVCNICQIPLKHSRLFDDKKCAEWLKEHLKYKGYHI